MGRKIEYSILYFYSLCPRCQSFELFILNTFLKVRSLQNKENHNVKFSLMTKYKDSKIQGLPVRIMLFKKDIIQRNPLLHRCGRRGEECQVLEVTISHFSLKTRFSLAGVSKGFYVFILKV